MDEPNINERRSRRAGEQAGARPFRRAAPEVGPGAQSSAPPVGGPDRAWPVPLLAAASGERARRRALADWEGEGGRILLS